MLLGSSRVTPIHIPPLFLCLAWDLMAHSREWCGQVMGVCSCGGRDTKVNVQISGQLYAHVKQESCIHLHYGLNYLEYMYMHCSVSVW